MLSNAYFLAKFRFDTAENEPAKKLQKLLNINLVILQNTHLTQAKLGMPARGRRRLLAARRRGYLLPSPTSVGVAARGLQRPG